MRTIGGRKPAEVGRVSGRRGMSTMTTLAVLLGIAVVVGAVGYVVLAAVGNESTSTTVTCSSTTSPACGGQDKTNDVHSAGVAAIAHHAK
jgi:hypothetical protein